MYKLNITGFSTLKNVYNNNNNKKNPACLRWRFLSKNKNLISYP